MTTARAPQLSEATFQRIREHVLHATGVQLANDRRALVAARLHKRLKTLQLTDYDTYLASLDEPWLRDERAHLLSLLTAHDTYFFREHRHFEFLARWLPTLGHPARLWSAACATGEEAWSLAMVAAETAGHAGWQVLGSDYDRTLLQQALAGVYDTSQARYFPDGWFRRYCLNGVDDRDSRLRIAPTLRDSVRFEAINLIQPLPGTLGAFDVIVLRNLLASFAEHYKADALQRLMAHLRPGGLLLIGHSEHIHGLDLPLRPLLPSVYERL